MRCEECGHATATDDYLCESCYRQSRCVSCGKCCLTSLCEACEAEARLSEQIVGEFEHDIGYYDEIELEVYQ